MKIWEVIRNLEIMSHCLKNIENIINELRYHKEWDEEYPKLIKKTNIDSRLDTIIDIAKKLKEVL